MIYEISDNTLNALEKTTFAESGIREGRLQQLLKEQVEIISPKTLVISEEFSSWDSKKRIDLLGIDRNANLVVIELKRTEDGGHMELQALRYAAMVSTFTFEQAVNTYEDFLTKEDKDADTARQKLLDFLGWESEEENEFAQDIRIVLASADFDKEIMSTVLWLNDNGLNIRCMRLKPFIDGNRTLIDIQQAIPLPEAEEYQIEVGKKIRVEKNARQGSRNSSKLTVTIGNQVYRTLHTRWAIYCVVKALFDKGVSPEDISETIPVKNRIFRTFDGDLSEGELKDKIYEQQEQDGIKPNPALWFYRDNSKNQPSRGAQPFKRDGKTYVLTNQWTIELVSKAIDALIKKFPDHNISYEKTTE